MRVLPMSVCTCLTHAPPLCSCSMPWTAWRMHIAPFGSRLGRSELVWRQAGMG
ncbi:hypothetical protein BC826DRAFT_1049006 [Russula brevipes]|nr:hypothetical protein BC826DRAFT_1049006 [Russula brevipes]